MIRESIDRRTLLLGVGGLVAVLAVAFSPQLLQDEVAAAVVGLEEASPAWLWLAALAFLGASSARLRRGGRRPVWTTVPTRSRATASGRS